MDNMKQISEEEYEAQTQYYKLDDCHCKELEEREKAASHSRVQENTALDEEIDRLRKALEEYGQHKETCVSTQYNVMNLPHIEGFPVKCDCGFNKALNGKESE